MNEPASLALVQERLMAGLALNAPGPASLRQLGGADILLYRNPNAVYHKMPYDRSVWPVLEDIDALLAHVERELKWLSESTLNVPKDTEGTTLLLPSTLKQESQNTTPVLTNSASQILQDLRREIAEETSSKSSTSESPAKATG